MIQILSLCLLALNANAQPPDPRALLLSPPCGDYRQPDSRELNSARSLFSKILGGSGDADEMRAQWEMLGFDWIPVRVAGEGMWILKEQPARCEGRGIFLFRPSAATPRLLQMPHRFHDVKTGEIGFRLMLQGGFKAAAWNSVHRNARGGDSDRGGADLAHNGDNYFTLLAEVAALLSSESRVVQIHGFDAAGRKTEAGRRAQLIISDGTRHPKHDARALAACLATRFDPRTRLFPYDVDELGATTNLIGARLREYGHRGFIHMELSRDVREALLSDEELMAQLGNCLSGGGR
jgi:hypothetical protein